MAEEQVLTRSRAASWPCDGLVIAPTYNEAENLPTLARRVLAYPGLHLLIIDDNSPDGTGQIGEQLREEWPQRVWVFHRPGKLGLGSAYVEGFRHALRYGYDVVFQMDADLSHDPADLPRLYAGLENAELCLGSRYVPGGGTPDWPFYRRLLSRFGSLYARTILGLPIHDLTGGFKAFRRVALQSLDLDAIGSTGYAFQIEVTHHCFQQGCRVVEVPILFAERRAGRSKMSLAIVREAALMVWHLRFEPRPASATPPTAWRRR